MSIEIPSNYELVRDRVITSDGRSFKRMDLGMSLRGESDSGEETRLPGKAQPEECGPQCLSCQMATEDTVKALAKKAIGKSNGKTPVKQKNNKRVRLNLQ